MATFYSQGNGNWSTLTNWDTVEGGGGSNPASVAAMDDQTFVIQAGHNIEFDIDSSGFAAGIAGITINGGATPGMLYSKYSGAGTYYLKLKTGTTIAGTTDTNRGRLLANSNGTWGATGALPFDRKFTIDLGATGYINAENLDIALYDTEPGIKEIDAYGTKYTCTEASTDVAPATDLITFAEATPPAAGTAVMVGSAGVLPGGLNTTSVYYVRSITDAGATFTCKLALQNDDVTIVDITSAGSGALYMYSGHTNTSTATLNVIQDVTGDAQWASGASVVLVDCNAPGDYDQQRVTINGAPNAGDITLSANVDSAQYPGAKIFLMTRNVAIRSSCVTSVNIVSYPSGATHGGVFQCEIRSTAGTGTTFYGNGIYYGTSHTISGTVSGCTNGIYFGTSHTISGTISGCNNGISSGASHTISGTISGCTYNFRFQNDIGSASINLQNILVRGRATCAFSSANRDIAFGGDQQVYFEDYQGVLGAQYAAWAQGDVIKNTATTRTGGAASSIEVVPLSSLAWSGGIAQGYVRPIDWTELEVAEDAPLTRTIYVKGEGWTSFPTNAQLYFEAEYLNHASALTVAVETSTQVLTDNTTWTALSVTFTPLQTGPVRYKCYLKHYEAGAKIYIDNALYRS